MAHVLTPARVPVGRAAAVVRAGLLALGAGGAAIAAGGGVLGLSSGKGLGPAQFEVLLVSALLFGAGVMRGPSRVLGSTIEWTRERRLRAPKPPADVARPLLLIVVGALVFRLFILGAYWPSNHQPMGMSLWDAEMARNLLQGRGWVLNQEFLRQVDKAQVASDSMVDLADYYPVPDDRPEKLEPFTQYAHTPGYSLWLAGSFLLGGSHRFIHSQLLQSALDASACLLVFGIGWRLWSPRAGLIGAAMYALSPAHAYLASQTVAAATDGFWTIAVAYGLVKTWTDLKAGNSGWPGAVVVALGAFGGTVMNSSAFVLPAAGAGMAAVIGLRMSPGWRVAAYMVAAQLLVVVLLVPWGFRNQATYGRFTMLRQSTWQLAWETLGQIPNSWGLGIGRDDRVYFDWVRANCPPPCTAVQRERITRDYLVNTVFRSPELPGHLLRLVMVRLPGLVYVARLPVDGRPLEGGALARAGDAALVALNFAALLALPVAVFGLVLLLVRSETAAPALLGLAPSLFVLMFSLLFFVEHRKTTPAYGYFAAMGGVALAACTRNNAEDCR